MKMISRNRRPRPLAALNLFLFAVLVLPAGAAAQAPQISFQSAGGFNAAAFGQYALSVTTPVPSAGAASMVISTLFLTLPGGPGYQPIALSTPLLVNDGANTETVTPSAVTCATGSCSVTATFAHAHPGNFTVASGSGGLQEALVWSHQHGGGKVVVGPGFPIAGSGAITAATGTSDTLIEDDRAGTEILYTWNGSAYTASAAVSNTGVTVGGAITIGVANAGTTGTGLNKLAKLTGAPSTAVVSGAGDTALAVGIVTAGAGTSGTATLAVAGEAACAFDGAATAGDYVQISSSSAGSCHDAGASTPASGEVVGRVLQTVASGTANVLLQWTRY